MVVEYRTRLIASPILFWKRPNAFASKVVVIVPEAPGAMGVFVQSASVQPQEVVIFDITKGLSPKLVILNVAVAGFFQRIVPMIFEKQVNKNFFKGMDIEKLFYNIINDPEIYNTRKPRKRNILEVFNKVSSHILLPDDYQTVISDGTQFIKTKRWKSSEFKRVHIDDRTLSLLTTPMLEELLEFSNIDNEYITNYLRQDILPKIQKQNYDFDKIFAHLKDGRWNSFNGIDYIYFNVIFEEIEKNSELKEKFINFIYSILCPNRNFNEIEEEAEVDVSGIQSGGSAI